MSLFRQTQGASPALSSGRVALLAIPLAVALVACGAKDGAQGGGAPGGGMPPAEVGVVTVSSQAAAKEAPMRIAFNRIPDLETER